MLDGRLNEQFQVHGYVQVGLSFIVVLLPANVAKYSLLDILAAHWPLIAAFGFVNPCLDAFDVVIFRLFIR